MRYWLFALVLAIAVTGCGTGPEPETDRREIADFLESYLPVLAEAYATGNLEPLRQFVAEKEIARVEKRVHDLAVEGRVFKPTFRSLTIEDVQRWNYANAFVTTHEVWDVRSVVAGTDTVLAEVLEQPNRVKYQLKLDGGRWRVLFRTIQE